MTELFWIDGPWRGRLAISARPRGGDWLLQEINEWQHAGIHTVVSLLTSAESQDLDLIDEALMCRTAGIEYLSFPIEDRKVPDSNLDVSRLLGQLGAELRSGKNVVIHCRQGVGRAGLIAASVLVGSHVDSERAIALVSRARGVPVPETEEQKAWVYESVSSAR